MVVLGCGRFLMSEVPLQVEGSDLQQQNLSLRTHFRKLQPTRWSTTLSFFFFFFTLVTGPRRSLSLKFSGTRVYAPQIRARLGTAAHGARPFYRCITQLTLGPDVVHIWSRIPQNSSGSKPSKSTEWPGLPGTTQGPSKLNQTSFFWKIIKSRFFGRCCGKRG